MDALGTLIRGVLILIAGAIMLGTGLCSLAFAPAVLSGLFSAPGDGIVLVVINLAGWGIAIGCFFLIKSLFGRSDADNQPHD